MLRTTREGLSYLPVGPSWHPFYLIRAMLVSLWSTEVRKIKPSRLIFLTEGRPRRGQEDQSEPIDLPIRRMPKPPWTPLGDPRSALVPLEAPRRPKVRKINASRSIFRNEASPSPPWTSPGKTKAALRCPKMPPQRHCKNPNGAPRSEISIQAD